MSNLKNYLFTSESVSEGHPDKVSDRISDMVVDTFISSDPYSRVACETLTTTNKVVMAGEVRGPKIKNDELIEKYLESGELTEEEFSRGLKEGIQNGQLIPVLCGIFLIENLSVVMQVTYFKYTKKKYGEGRRIFLMSPLHHHYQKKNIHESKITARFWIVAILLAVITIVTLKVR